MRIAVDFDGTIVENRYPGIGEEKPYAVSVLKQLAAEGDQIILWTVRTDQPLQDAVTWCDQHGITFYAVNSNHHRCVKHQNCFSGARKITADIFIDDQNIGGLQGWLRIYFKIARMKRYSDRVAKNTFRIRLSDFMSVVDLIAWNLTHRRGYLSENIYFNPKSR